MHSWFCYYSGKSQATGGENGFSIPTYFIIIAALAAFSVLLVTVLIAVLCSRRKPIGSPYNVPAYENTGSNNKPQNGDVERRLTMNSYCAESTAKPTRTSFQSGEQDADYSEIPADHNMHDGYEIPVENAEDGYSAIADQSAYENTRVREESSYLNVPAEKSADCDLLVEYAYNTHVG